MMPKLDPEVISRIRAHAAAVAIEQAEVRRKPEISKVDYDVSALTSKQAADVADNVRFRNEIANGDERNLLTKVDAVLAALMVSYLYDLKGKSVLTFNADFIDPLLESDPSINIVYIGSENIDVYLDDNVQHIKCNLWNIQEVKSMLKKLGRKFDVVIGNPPYNDSGSGNDQDLWQEIFEIAFDLVENDGYFSLITPNGWGNVGNKKELFKKYFQKYSTKSLCIESDALKKNFFKGVGSTFSWYVIRKTISSNKLTQMVGADGKNKGSMNLNDVEFLPKNLSSLTFSILGKLFSKPSLGVSKKKACHSSNDKLFISKNEDQNYPFKVRHGKEEDVVFWFSKLPNDFYAKKIVFSKWVENGIKPSYDNGSIGMSEDIYRVLVSSEETGNNTKKYLTSKLLRFLVDSTQASNRLSSKIAEKIPAIDLTRSYTDAELYAYFNLTAEEVAHVEASVK